MNVPWEEKKKQDEVEEQRFIDAWAETSTTRLQKLFPVTSKTITDEHGNRTHESLNTCKHKHITATRWIPLMIEQEVDREIPDTDWNEATKTWEHNGKFRTIRTMEVMAEGREREWKCKDCLDSFPEHVFTDLYPEIKFDKKEIDLP